MYAVIFQSQSMASAVRLTTKFVRGVRVDEALRAVLFREIFIHTEEVIRLMGGDPQLTVGSGPIAQRLNMLDAAVPALLENARNEGRTAKDVEAIEMAQALTRHIKALTATKLRGLWTDLKELRRKIRERPDPGSPR